MAQQIIKQPDGKYALWSTITNDFIFVDANRENIEEFWVNEAKEKYHEQVNKICDDLDAGRKPYHQFTMTYQEAMKQRLLNK